MIYRETRRLFVMDECVSLERIGVVESGKRCSLDNEWDLLVILNSDLGQILVQVLPKIQVLPKKEPKRRRFVFKKRPDVQRSAVLRASEALILLMFEQPCGWFLERPENVAA